MVDIVDPLDLLDNPFSKATQQQLSLALADHMKTGRSMDDLLQLRTPGGGPSARVRYLRRERGALLMLLFQALQDDGYKPRDASNNIHSWLSGHKPPQAYLSDVNCLCELSSQLNAKTGSQAALYARFRRIELETANLLLAL